MSTDSDRTQPVGKILTYILACLGILTMAIWEFFFHHLESEHHWWARGICVVTFILATAAFVENRRGFSLRRRFHDERKKLEGESAAAIREKATLQDAKTKAETELTNYTRTAGHLAVLDLQVDADHINYRIREAFAQQDINQRVLAFGSFNENGSPLALEALLQIKLDYPKQPLNIIDTQLPFPRREQLISILAAHENLYFYACHSGQAFDPILIFSNEIIFCFMGKCIIVPTATGISQHDRGKFMEELIANCFFLIPDFSKKLEYFVEILPKLSRRLVEELKDDGYSFSAKHSGLWFAEPLKMSLQKVEDIKNEMDRDFKTFSEDILPKSTRVIANWPLTTESDLTLVGSESVLNWTAELKIHAEQRLAQNDLLIRRYFYVSADQRWDGKKNVITIKGANWQHRATNQHKSFSEVISFLRTNFLSTPGNYQSYIVLVPGDKADLVNHFSTLNGQSHSLIQIDEILSNWIIFHCDEWGLNILQYEKKFDYGIDQHAMSSFYAFYYNDFVNQRSAAMHRVDRYSNYSHLLDTAVRDVERMLQTGPQRLKKVKVHVLPIRVFFEWLDEGQIIIEAGQPAKRGG